MRRDNTIVVRPATWLGIAAIVVSVGLVWPTTSRAQEPPPGAAGPPAGPLIPQVDDFQHDGNVGEWRARPIDRILPATGHIPQALLWVGQVAEGIVVAAEIRSGVAPDEGATLRIGLRGAGDLEFPPIGWGHQFGFVVLEDQEDCEDREFGDDDPSGCREWYTRQLDYRAALPPLFEREWRVQLTRPEEVVEALAGPAFERLPESVRHAIGPLAPRGMPTALTRPIAGTQGGLGVELLIPWSAFPPVRAPDLSAVQLTLEWLAPEISKVWDAAWLAGAEARPLQNPLEHTITPCGYGLAGLLIPGGDHRLSRPASPGAVPYMIPEESGDLRSLIVLDNVAAGYLYEADGDTWSPAAFEPTYGVLDVGRDERICTPVLAYAKAGERTGGPDWSETGEGDWFGLQVDPRELDVRRLDDGDLLVKSGSRVTWSYYGSGQCGACPRVGIDFFHISAKTGTITPALRFFEIAEPTVRDIEIDVAEDWSTVTIFQSEPRFDAPELEIVWKLTRYCMVELPGDPTSYEVCAEESDVAEPPSHLRQRYSIDP
ncbi:MAG: hypothetical protein ACC682_05530 [Gemmatimonadota bacterium]